MAKKAQKVKKKNRSELLIVNPDAAGIDIASNEYQVCVPEDRDSNHNRRFEAFTCDLEAIAQWLHQCRIKTVAMEATGIYWVQLYIVLEKHGFDVVVCNAKHIKNLGEKKTDYVDAGWIQLLHTYGLLTESFQPENQIRELKNLSRHRERLIDKNNQSILRIQKSLDMMNIKVHKVLSDIKGVSGLAILQAIVKGVRDPKELAKHVQPGVKASREEIHKSLEGNWSVSQVFILKQNFDAYNYTLQQIKELDHQIEELLASYAQIREINNKQDVTDNATQTRELVRSKKKKDANNAPHFDAEKYAFGIFGVNLTRIPGISGLTAFKLAAELGANFTDKFPTVDKFCAWLNLVPSNKESGGKIISSKLPKRKNYAGQIIRVAANTLKNHKGYLGDVFKTKKARLGYNQAVIAVAHKISRIIYVMVDQTVEYDESLEQRKTQKNLEKKLDHLRKKLLLTEKQLSLCA